VLSGSCVEVQHTAVLIQKNAAARHALKLNLDTKF